MQRRVLYGMERATGAERSGRSRPRGVDSPIGGGSYPSRARGRDGRSGPSRLAGRSPECQQQSSTRPRCLCSRSIRFCGAVGGGEG
jgi:hypothetical protein